MCDVIGITRTRCRFPFLALICLFAVLAPQARSQQTTEVAFIGITCPPDTTVECPDDVPPPDTTRVTVTTTCPPATVTFVGDVWAPGNDLLVRTYAAVDACGQTDTASQAIIISDKTPPEITCPPDTMVSCPDDVPAPDVNLIVATDNCEVAEVVFVGDVESPGTCPKIITRTYKAFDHCANSATCEQIITIDDNTPPVLAGCPSDTRVQCGPLPPPANVTATDNCDPSVTPVYTQTPADPTGCSGTVTRRWIATDRCGNADTCIQVITIDDDTPPVLAGCPGNTTAQCGALPPPANVTATDNCDASVVPIYSQVPTNPTGCSGTVTRRWIATDDCGNADTCVQIITIIDDVPPVLVGCPDNTTAPCDALPPPANVTATDNCDPSVVPVYSQVPTNPTGCSGTVTRRWIATDDCGNADTCIQVITLNDNVPPVLVGCPNNETVECGPLPPPAIVTATDNCDASVVPVYSQTPPSLAGCGTVTRRWIATDDCGNADTCVQTLSVIDEIDPALIGCPNDTTVSCGEIPVPPTVTATDNCDLSVVPEYSQTQPPTGCEGSFTRRWIATDDCGNADTCVQTITVVDQVAPVLIGCPDDTTVACGDIPEAPSVTATDNCDPSVVSEFSQTAIPEHCGTFVRRWIATDDCGNADTCEQTINVIDTIAPVLSGCPNGTIVFCGQVPAAAVVSALDNCDASVAPVFSQVPLTPGCPGTVLRRWVATDDCGNADSCDQIITIIPPPPPPPSVECPPDTVVSCPDDVPAPDPALVVVTDGCDPVVEWLGDAPSGLDECDVTISRSYRAVDTCGYADTCIQLIVVIDTTKPSITCPPALTVSCPDDVPTPDTGLVVARDECGQVTVTFEGDVSSPGTCPRIITRTYAATDACGNVAICTQIITVNDTIPPVLAGCPNDTLVRCGPLPPAANVTATDNCDDEVEIVFAETSFKVGDCRSVVRSWIAIDDCGNADTCDQIIKVVDYIPPTLVGCPLDTTVLCGAVPPPAVVTATDDCDPSVIPVFTQVPPEPSCPGTVTRRWVATDGCGNADTCEQVITIIGPPPPPPSVQCPPDTTVACLTAVPAPDTARVQENGDCGQMHVEWVGDIASGPGSCIVTISRTYRVVDTCGGTDSCVQLIHISDTIDPVLSGCPNDTTIACGEVPAVANVTATDNCDPSVVLVFSQSAPAGDCDAILRRWIATDDCGNADTCEQLILRQSLGGSCDTICGAVYNSDCPGTTCVVVGATVQLWDTYPAGAVLQTDTTDSNGNFCFAVQPGVEYDLRIFTSGFCTDVFNDVVCAEQLLLGLDSLDFVLPESPIFHDFWSLNATADGLPVLPGDVIYACDSNGVIIGLAYVKNAGEYLIHVLGNVPKGPPDTLDEGADPGEVVSLWLNCGCPLQAPVGFINFGNTRFDADWTCEPIGICCELCPGWNMFSYNIYLNDYSRESVLTSIDLNYNAVRSGRCVGNLISWFEGRPINDLSDVTPWYGYDINTTALDTLCLEGARIPAETELILCAGWNYIPYYPTEADSRTHALQSIAGNYTNIYTLWCNDMDSWNSSRPALLNDLNCLEPCRGYWIKLIQDDTLIYPSDGYECIEAPAKLVNQGASSRVPGSPISCDFWSVTDPSISGLRAGDAITVRTETGLTIGESEVRHDGSFLIHAFGDVPSTQEVEGAIEGQSLFFTVNGEKATVDGNGTFSHRADNEITVYSTGASPVPSEHTLLQNYPNPFNAGTVIPFTLESASDWTVTIYDIAGRQVYAVRGRGDVGEVNVEWNGHDDNGVAVASGIYFYRVTTAAWEATRKMTLLK